MARRLPDGRPDYRTLDDDLGPAEVKPASYPPAIERAGDPAARSAAQDPPAGAEDPYTGIVPAKSAAAMAAEIRSQWAGFAYQEANRRARYTAGYSGLCALASASISAVRHDWEVFTVCALWVAVAATTLWYNRKV